MAYEIEKTDDEWTVELSPQEFHVLRQAGTERPWSGALLDEERAGTYSCRACGAELFDAGTKFDAGCGWPSFYEASRSDAVELLDDDSLGMRRTEVQP